VFGLEVRGERLADVPVLALGEGLVVEAARAADEVDEELVGVGVRGKSGPWGR
jgi:hypothetical protein